MVSGYHICSSSSHEDSTGSDTEETLNLLNKMTGLQVTVEEPVKIPIQLVMQQQQVIVTTSDVQQKKKKQQVVNQSKSNQSKQHIVNQSDIAVIKLRNACACSIVFMTVEFVGGYFARSLALTTDGTFLLSDVASYAMSLFALHIGSLAESAKMPFGYHRAEVIGAIISVSFIWILTGWLMFTAFERLFQDAPLDSVDGETMFFVSLFGLSMNVLLIYILGAGNSESPEPKEAEHKFSKWWWMNLGESENINVRAAYIHALGDFIQTLGICLSGGLIWYNPQWKIADPITTIIFSLPVLISTRGIIIRSIKVIMEAAPEHIQVDILQKQLEQLASVQQVTEIYAWSVTQDRTAVNVHLVHNGDSRQALKEAKSFLAQEGFQWITIQVEDLKECIVL